MAVPVDVLSYAIGLFTTVSWRVYTAATLIGIMPFAFIFSYTSAAPLYFRIGVLALAGFAVLLGYRRVRRKLS
jgi:uncharacterized membrane protein YdjX (TVP38/TMEM64 family)